jgi:hypothetical protein
MIDINAFQISPEKESRQRLNENMYVQRSCASFITQLIGINISSIYLNMNIYSH